MSSVNSGVKRVLTLRKYVNGVATDETKQNLAADPDYIADYTDEAACPIGQATTTTTTAATTTTTTAATTSTTTVEGGTTTSTTTTTTTTTTLPQNFTNQTLTVTGYTALPSQIIEGNYSYDVYAERTFYVPSGTGPFTLNLTASFTTGQSAYSARARFIKSDSSTTISMGTTSGSTEANPHVSVSVSDTQDSSVKTGQTLSAGYWKMQVYDIEGPSSGTFGNTTLSITEE